MDLGDLIVSLLGAVVGGGNDRPAPRPQGPGLNIGEANVRRAVGLPTTARRTAHATSSGPGMGQERINEIRQREGRKAYGSGGGGGSKKLPKRFANKKGTKDSDHNDFNLGRIDSTKEWGQELSEEDSFFGTMKRVNSPSNIWESIKGANEDMKGWTPGEGVVDVVSNIHETVNKPWLSYDGEEGLDADWGAVGDKLGMASFAVPAGRVGSPFIRLGKGVNGPVSRSWFEAGRPAPVNRQLPRGPYRMGPAMDETAGIPKRFGGRVRDPRASNRYNDVSGLPNNAPLSGRGPRNLGPSRVPDTQIRYVSNRSAPLPEHRPFPTYRGAPNDPNWPPMPTSDEVERHAVAKAEDLAMRMYERFDPPWAW